jgi:tetratricopeptide (TPR) repeat protein
MSARKSTYHSKLYRDFKAIEGNAYQEMIRYYEDHETAIRGLDFEEYFDLLVSYVDALFEVGAYRNHLLMVDVVIETSIEENIVLYKGRDLFKEMLFRKAASHFNRHEHQKAEHILRQYISIYPKDEQGILFMKKCLRKQKPKFLTNAHAVTIFLLLLTALIIAIEVLFVRPFYGIYVDLVEQSRISMFILACTILVSMTLVHRWKVEVKVERFVKQTRAKKKSN